MNLRIFREVIKILCNIIHDGRKEDFVKWKIMLLSHSIEKGMGMKNVKPGYGKEKAKELLKYLEYYIVSDHTECYEVQEALAVLDAYIKFKKEKGSREEIEEIEQKITALINSKNNDNIKSGKGGIDQIQLKDIQIEETSEVEKLFLTRHSIRRFKNKPLNIEKFEQAIRLAMTAPSACNRQPIKIYLGEKENSIFLAQCVPGNNGFRDEIYHYLLVTADKTAFGPAEGGQWYVNGGIFISHLVLALHMVGIESCIFQWTRFNRKEKFLRELFKIPHKEVIIAVIGIGEALEVNSCLVSNRKPLEDVLVYVK